MCDRNKTKVHEAEIVVYDVGSTYTKVASFAIENRTFRFLGRGQSETTTNDIQVGVSNAEEQLLQCGVRVAAGTKRYSSCSAAGGLRMVALGYMPRVTVKAAYEVAMTAGARVMQVVSADEPIEFRREVLSEIYPDIILLSGGTDGGDEENAIENANMIVDLKLDATVIVACNKFVQKTVAEHFDRGGIRYVRVPNILPTIHELNVKPAREVIHEEFTKQITHAKGLLAFRDTLVDRQVIPTPGAVFLAAELLAKGTYDKEGIGDLIVVDVGGATTDIHSVLPELENLSIEERGLVINNEKQFSYRTVEGNLGLRVSATGILEAVGPNAVLRVMDNRYNLVTEDVLEFARKLEDDPSFIPQNDKELSLDRALATCAINTALRRHAGYYAKETDPVMGIMAGTPKGRDLRNVESVLCVGGIFVHTPPDKGRQLVDLCFVEPGLSLLPYLPPKVIIDHDYVIYCMGVLAKYYPEEALNFLKTYVGYVDHETPKTLEEILAKKEGHQTGSMISS